MSETARKLFDALRASSIGAEVKRMGTQGSMELASALFNQSGFVPYGPGQYTPTPGQEHQKEQERGGMER